MKALMDEAGVATPKWAVVDRAEALRFTAFPAIVKPAAEHCSYGITRDSVVMNEAEARRQASRIIEEFKQPALIEEFLDSAEYNVTVWGAGDDMTVLGISSMTYEAFSDIHDRLCTFDAKWTPASEAYQRIPATCPAPVSEELKRKIEAVSVAAYRASGCRDYGRVDLRLQNGEPMALDINANCDVSPDGGFAHAAEAAGMNYGEMLERVVQMAVQRMPAFAAPALAEVSA
jgi:D-alanine-D-alanine ligase